MAALWCCFGAGCDDGGGDEATATVTGTAFAFALPGMAYGLIDGGTVSVLEAPEVSAQTRSDGTFELVGVPSNTEVTFVIEADGFPVAQTKTFEPLGGDLDRLTFQVPDDLLYDSLASLLAITPSPERCQLVTTVTRVGKSLFDEGAHGEAGATVRIEPTPGEGEGPIYFGSDVLPDRALTETSDDGGVLFVNLPPGTYTLSADKDGVNFEPIEVNCRAGVLTNASPPYGLQAQ